MIATILLAFSLLSPANGPFDNWFGEDKLKHFFTSFVATSLAASGSRIVGADVSDSRWIGVAAGSGVGLMKEVYDYRAGGPFSIEDLFWDAGGISSATLFLYETR